MSPPTVRLGRLGQISMHVVDLSRAVAFYRDMLGIPFLFEVPGLAFFDLDGVRLMLSRPEGPEQDHATSILYFQVPDLELAHATLAGSGVTFDHGPSLIATMPDHDLWMAFFKDSEGNQLALMSEVREP
jgi:methylmalonyl-CoA/ethylmalonyl-CoA epimerase